MFDFLLLGSGFVELVDMDDCCGVVLFEFIDMTAAVGEFLLIATFLPNYLSCVWMVLGDLLKLEIFIH